MVSFLSWFFLMENTWFCWLITSPRLHLLLLLQPSLLLIPPCYHRLPCLLLFFNSFPTVLFSYPIWFYPSLFPRSLLVSSSPMSPCLLFRILHLTDLFIPLFILSILISFSTFLPLDILPPCLLSFVSLPFTPPPCPTTSPILSSLICVLLSSCPCSLLLFPLVLFHLLSSELSVNSTGAWQNMSHCVWFPCRCFFFFPSPTFQSQWRWGDWSRQDLRLLLQQQSHPHPHPPSSPMHTPHLHPVEATISTFYLRLIYASFSSSAFFWHFLFRLRQ